MPIDPSPLGPLAALVGKWAGTGFNVIWRPSTAPGQDHFLALNQTTETLEFGAIASPILNRGLLQPDIEMFGLTYRQEIADKTSGDPLHVEPGLWANVPATTNPAEVPTVVRMASVPHGVAFLSQGLATTSSGKPVIAAADITPFEIGIAAATVRFPPEQDVSVASAARSPDQPAQLATLGITQAMIDNPNSILEAVLSTQAVSETIELKISSDATTPVPGGGIMNTAFLQGIPAHGPNAQAVLTTATFWIETVKGVGVPDFQQLQYTQTVLLNFNGLSWPHISVATLLRA